MRFIVIKELGSNFLCITKFFKRTIKAVVIEICLFVFQPDDGGTRCDNVGPVGCIYADLIPSHLQNQLKIQVSDLEDFPDVTKCLLGCRAIFPDAFFAGVRVSTSLDNGRKELECSCLQSHAYNSSTLGPSANCNQVCMLE